MGRYYTGDIEGKFWFAVRSSTDAGFFGGEESEPNHIDYHFDKTHLPTIKKGVKECRKQLGKYKKLLDKFFSGKDTYDNKMIEKEPKVYAGK